MGRLTLNIETIKTLIAKGFNGIDIAKRMEVSRQTIYRRAEELGLYELLKENAAKKQALKTYKDGRAIYKRFKKGSCQICSATEKLECHHIIPVKYASDYGKMISGDHSESNIVTLCSSCHKKEHKRLREIEKQEK